ncbi:MAG TPA: hypothetical protein VKB55_16415 [Nocardioidaceae bacterium]|nr:hypothetical protein [Nocardioidaceae bacterium]
MANRADDSDDTGSDPKPAGTGKDAVKPAAKPAAKAPAKTAAKTAKRAEPNRQSEGPHAADDDDADQPTPESQSAEAPDVSPTRDGRTAVFVTTALCAIFAGGGHLTLLIAAQGNNEVPFPWQPVVGLSLALVATISFGGYFYASLRARVAIAASFVVTFLLILTYALTLTQLGEWDDNSLADSMMSDFRVIVQTIIAFYFGTETLITVTKIVKIPSSAGSTAITRSDRDLPSGSVDAGHEAGLLKRMRGKAKRQ